MEAPLPSWNDGKAKSDILEFIKSVTEPGPGFVPASERVATFDNDGTLWCEKPMYVQADFLFRRWKVIVDADPAKAAEQPYKALVENDRAWLSALLDHVPELTKGVTEAYNSMTVDAFDNAVRAFFADARHPTLGRLYTDVGYKPMIELLDLLRANAFRVFICTGGGRDFVRPVAEEMYGVPRENVIGSGTTLEYTAGNVYRTKGIEQPIDDGSGKPVHIWTRTGRKPLFAGGNSDGDIAMLETAKFAMLVHHDDAAREFAYDSGTEHALVEAKTRGWTVVSMKDDFAVVFDAAASTV
jgi:phosphoglycolate phosphatase-like HAD superfamily hydrolase